MRDVIKSMFDEPETRVVECASGDEAVRRYDTASPDWVLMDIRLKGMDGITASRTIINQHPEAKVIIVTECMEPALRDAARTMGTYGYVAKEDLFSVKRIMGL
ncbi:MAG: response regulator transcription factor [Ignavibacteriae bacterium]|nr:response regulator transcription factor [Ignavibacteriota bacterium]